MNITLGETHLISWTTQDPATGASATPSAQTVTFLEEGTDMGYAPTVNNPGTGEYNVNAVFSSGNGFEAGKLYQIKVAATVGGVSMKGIVFRCMVRAKGLDDLASTGAKMDIIDAPNATAVTAIQSGLSKPGTAQTITAPADMALNSTVAKEATLGNRPTLAQIEASTVLAKVSDIPSASSVANAIGGRTVPKTSGKTYDQVMEISAALAGAKLSGMVSGSAGTTTLRTLDDSQDLVVATQDSNGNRTAVTVTP